MTKKKRGKRTMNYRRLTIEYHESHLKPGEMHVLWKLTYVFLYEKYGYVLYKLKI
jgi:hypothetical protein